jgi:hypothetical protein
MWSLADTADGGDDAELAQRLLRALPEHDHREAILTARLANLEYAPEP